jgi:hypothetical protein
LGRNALRRTQLRQSGAKARGIAACAAKNLFVGPGQIRDMSSGGATLSGSGLI